MLHRHAINQQHAGVVRRMYMRDKNKLITKNLAKIDIYIYFLQIGFN